MKRMLFIPIAVAIAVAVGAGLMHSLHQALHWPELLAAGCVSTGTALLAAFLPWRARVGGQAAVVQFGFYATVLHMGLTIASALAGVLVFRLTMQPYVLWLLWFFWVTLATLSWTTIGLIRSTPMQAASRPQPLAAPATVAGN